MAEEEGRPSTVRILVNHFQSVLENSGCETGAVAREWLAMKAHLSNRVDQNQPLPAVYHMFLLGEEDRQWFTNVLMVVEITLVLPMSTANCERGFSAMKRIKSDWRASLTTEMLDLLLLIWLEGWYKRFIDALTRKMLLFMCSGSTETWHKNYYIIVH